MACHIPVADRGSGNAAETYVNSDKKLVFVLKRKHKITKFDASS
jgi:hypothetical protein